MHGAYNHGWLIGDESAISARTQAELDGLLEIAPQAERAEEAVAQPNSREKVEPSRDPPPAQRGREVTVEDVRQLMGASTPHFALQLRNASRR